LRKFDLHASHNDFYYAKFLSPPLCTSDVESHSSGVVVCFHYCKLSIPQL